MNEKFFELPKEKQISIINAGMDVFGKNDYKRAITDEIAHRAGISKGLLFYYFHNKQGLYTYLYHYCFELMKGLVMDENFQKISDFFELMEYGASKKMALLKEHPGITDFVMRAYFSNNETISGDVNRDMRAEMEKSYSLYFNHIDFTKFKDDIDPPYVYRMLTWMCDGYMHELQSNHQEINLDNIMKDFHIWKEMFKKIIYKEEYL